ncbi:MAG: SpoIIE family protein phosphatase [Acidobacteriota bacterium]|nr:SpoIIE family protein phosphatase [Acidobacteriota bacterium]
MLPRRLHFPGLLAMSALAIGLNVSQAQHLLHKTNPVAPTLAVDGLGKGTAALDGVWQFHLGDDMAWASPGYNDGEWDQIMSAKPWGLQGHDSYTGYAWYRRHITISPAPGASQDVALLIPEINDVYEIYWNGQLVGRSGHMPPHWVAYIRVPPQTYGLGPVRSGVLAVRVWKLPLVSTDDGTAGGFNGSPLIGSPEAIAAVKGDLDFKWLRSRQFHFALTSLYGLVALLGFFAWYRDRRQWLLFWTAMFSSSFVAELFLTGLRLQASYGPLTFWTQTEISLREMSQWFLLLWLLKLQDNRQLVVLTRKVALISVFASVLDGVTILLYPSLLSASGLQVADAVLTAVMIFFEIFPVMLVAYAFLHRKSLESSRWVVAAVAFLNGMVYFAENISVQGVRYTHWNLSDDLTKPLFTFAGSAINTPLLLRTLLFFSILYAVVRVYLDGRRRTSSLEQELQNARELQRVLVPSSLPVVPGFTITSAYRPAAEVGGDFFQVMPLESGSTLVLLGDVSGKGLRAAMAVSLIIGAVRALAEDHPSPARLLTQLNRRLCGHLQGGFATCVVLRLDPNGDCALSSAGHPAPFLNERELELPGALPLGISREVDYEESAFTLKIGDHFSLYTDGLLEARSPSGELYSFARLQRLFASHPSAAQATQAAINFGQDDDITVLTLTRMAVNEAMLELTPA